MVDPPRYAPDRALPRYRYVPGLTPHPHDVGTPNEPAAPDVPCERFFETEAFRFGVDLWNRAFFWEAHEVWESLWKACPREKPEKEALQGLIQLAAALLKEHLSVDDGTRRLSKTGREKLERALERGVRPSFDLADLIRRSREHFAWLDDPEAPRTPRPGIRLS